MLDFSDALEALRDGRRVARTGWNGKNMYLTMVKTWSTPDHSPAANGIYLPFIVMRTVQGDLVPWLCSQTDALATDWDVLIG